MQATASNMQALSYDYTAQCTPPQHGIPDGSHNHRDDHRVCMSHKQHAIKHDKHDKHVVVDE